MLYMLLNVSCHHPVENSPLAQKEEDETVQEG